MNLHCILHINYSVILMIRKERSYVVLGRKQYYWIIHLQIKGETFLKKWYVNMEHETGS